MSLTNAFSTGVSNALKLSKLATANYKGPGKTTVKIGTKSYSTPEFGITEKSGVTSKQPMTVTIDKSGISVKPTSQPKQQKETGGSGGRNKSSAPSAPSELDLFEQQTGLAKSQAKQQAQQLQSEYDYARELLAGQEQQAVSERDIAKSQLEQALQQVMQQGGRAKESAVQQAESATEQAASAAKQAERKTRGTLRGLGILASSAAGELLSRPATEFQKVGADIQTQLSNKVKEVDDFLTAKTEENALKVQELLSNYASIVDRIRTDLRFNQREKLSALQQNKLALGQALSEVRANQVNYQMAVNTYKNNLLSEAGGLGTPLQTSGIQERIMNQMPQAPKQQTTQDAEILKRRRYYEPNVDIASTLS